MQEIFEKIIEKFEKNKECYKEIRRNTYCRVTETSECDSCRADHYLDERLKCIDDAIEIIKQEAEEYDNGWIPCSERTPKLEDISPTKGQEFYVTMKRKGSNYSFVRKLTWNFVNKNWEWSNGKTLADEWEVLAWRHVEVPEPYQQKGE